MFKHLINLFIILFIHLSPCFSQQKRYNFTFKDARLEVVIKELSNQSKINILYNPGILPSTVKITGTFKNITLYHALDTFLHQAQIIYKFYKGDIVLYKKNENLKEEHQLNRSNPQKKNIPEKSHETITDTVTYTIITHDTVVTKLTDYVKVQINDTVTVYDTTKVIQKVIKTVDYYKPKKKSFIMDIYFSKSAIFPNIQMAKANKKFSGNIRSSITSVSGNNVGVNFVYRNKKINFGGGIAFTKCLYSFTYTNQIDEFITVTDTIDKYYTAVVQGDTSWVYVTRERQVERLTEKKYLSDLEYRFISVPLVVGYTWIVKNFTFEFKGGVLFNFYMSSKGNYLNINEDNEISIEDSKAPGAVILLGAYGGVNIDYYLNKKVHIFTQPFINWNAVPIGKNHAAYTVTDFQIGFQAGMRYFF
jgi:hypothetical protein